MPVTKSEPEPIGRICPEDGGELVIRYGRFGKFISCANFPTCRYTEPWLEKIGVTCPKDGGDLVERQTRKGRTFYGCVNYPNCDFTSWKKPLVKPCPKCNGLLVVANKREAQCTNCSETFSCWKRSCLKTRENYPLVDPVHILDQVVGEVDACFLSGGRSGNHSDHAGHKKYVV
jgi:ssDNA-binding Zn-finger/Zn-ribbon topoisomerase 1